MTEESKERAKRRPKVGKLELNKETLQDLTETDIDPIPAVAERAYRVVNAPRSAVSRGLGGIHTARRAAKRQGPRPGASRTLVGAFLTRGPLPRFPARGRAGHQAVTRAVIQRGL
jgi:hypothetical protein